MCCWFFQRMHKLLRPTANHKATRIIDRCRHFQTSFIFSGKFYFASHCVSHPQIHNLIALKTFAAAQNANAFKWNLSTARCTTKCLTEQRPYRYFVCGSAMFWPHLAKIGWFANYFRIFVQTTSSIAGHALILSGFRIIFIKPVTNVDSFSLGLGINCSFHIVCAFG